MLAAIQSVGRGDDVRAQLEGRDVRVSGAVFRHESRAVSRPDRSPRGRTSTANMPDVWEFIAALPDAAVVVDADFNIPAQQ